MVNDDSIANGDFSASTSFQIEHHEESSTNSPIIYIVSVQTNLRFVTNINDGDIYFF